MIPYRTFDIDSIDNRDEDFVRSLLPLVSFFEKWNRARVRGVQRIPEGPALYVGNHSASMLSIDTFLFCAEVYRQRGMRDMPYGLAHDTAMKAPLTNQILAMLGGVRACHENAARLFERGSKVMVYPGGDVDAMRPWRDRNRIRFGGRQGYIRLALHHGVPIVPVVSVGSHETFIVFDDLAWLAQASGAAKHLRLKVLPLSWSIPWGLTLGPVPPFFPLPVRVLIDVLDPITFDRAGAAAAADPDYVAACAERVEAQMQRAMDALVIERRRMGPLGPLRSR